MTDARREDYWSELEASETSVAELVAELLDEEDDGADLRALAAAGQEGDELFTLYVATKVRDDHLIMTQGYAKVNLTTLDAELGKNKVRMRVQGSLVCALKVMYAAIADEAATPENPMLVDARDVDGIRQQPELLSDPLADDPDEGRRERRDQRAGRNPDLFEDQGEGPKECRACGEAVDPQGANAVNVGGPAGVDLWAHESCPDDEEESR
jgi:hypothetical protein